MNRINYIGLVAAVVAAFIASSLWYSPVLFGKLFLELSGFQQSPSPSALRIAFELARTFVLAGVLAHFGVLLKLSGWVATLRFSIVLWVGFPVVLLSGSVSWQNVPWALAAIHGGDWLVKILLITSIVVFSSQN